MFTLEREKVLDQKKKALAEEAGIHPPQLVYYGEFEFNQLLDPTAKLDPAELGSERTIVRVFDLPKYQIFSVVFPETDLYGTALQRLLSNSSPWGRNFLFDMDPSGIYDDWRMPDHTDEIRYNSLPELHASLGRKWLEFITKDRPVFMRALTVPSPDEVRQLLDKGLSQILTGYQARALVNQEMSQVAQTSYPVRLPLTGFNFTLPFDELPDTVKEKLLTQAGEDALSGKHVINPADPPKVIETMKNAGKNETRPIVIESEGDGIIKISCESSWVRYDFNGEFPLEIDSSLAKPEKHALKPWILWARRKSSGERIYWTMDTPGEIASGTEIRHSRRMGMLLATASSPITRDRLPRRVKIKNRIQNMRESSMPLLVHIHEDKIMHARVFESIEHITGVTKSRIPERFRNIFYRIEEFCDAIRRRTLGLTDAAQDPLWQFVAGAIITASSLLDHQLNRVQIDWEVNKAFPNIQGVDWKKMGPEIFNLIQGIDDDQEIRQTLLSDISPSLAHDQYWAELRKQNYDINLDPDINRAERDILLAIFGACLAAYAIRKSSNV